MSAGTFRMRREAAEQMAAEAAAKAAIEEKVGGTEEDAPEAPEPVREAAAATVTKPKPKAPSRAS